MSLDQDAEEEFGFAVKKKWGRGASPGFDGRGTTLRGSTEWRIFMWQDESRERVALGIHIDKG